MRYPHLAWIGLGSNLGDSKKIILDAWGSLGNDEQVQPLKLSSLYKTEPVGMNDDANWFINAAGVMSTSLTPQDLLEKLLQLEKKFGRARSSMKTGYQSRTLDLDLLLYNDSVLQSPILQIPHPRLHERGFVLIPLAEIAPEVVHPTMQKQIAELCEELPADITEQIEQII